MLSTMQDSPLTVGAILRYAVGVHGDRLVSTATGGGFRQATYRQVGRQATRLAHALRRLGIEGDQRVATFMWNNQEHLEAYVAVPSMGAVLHTLNIRLFPEQIEFVAYEAEDQVVIADLSLAPILAPVLPRMETVHTVIAVGSGDLRHSRPRAREWSATTKSPLSSPTSSTGRTSMKTPLRQCVTPAALPVIRRVSSIVIGRAICTRLRSAVATAWD